MLDVVGGEVGGGLADVGGGAFGDAAAPFVAEDEGDGGLGDPCGGGHVAAGGSRHTGLLEVRGRRGLVRLVRSGGWTCHLSPWYV